MLEKYKFRLVSRYKFSFTYLILIALIVLVSYASYTSFVDLDKNSREIVLNAEPMNVAVHNLLLDLLNEEVGTRDYLMSRNSQSLIPFYDGQTNLNSDLAVIHKYEANYPVIQTLFEQQAKPQIDALQQYFHNQIDLAQKGQIEEARLRFNQGQDQMDKFRSTHKQMEQAIEQMRTNTWIQDHQTSKRSRMIILMGLAIALLALLLFNRVRQAEKRLAQSNQRYRSLFEQNPAMICSFDLDGYFTKGNAAVEQTTGYREDELLSTRITRYIAPEDLKRVMYFFERTKIGKSENFEVHFLHKLGHSIALGMKFSPMVVDGEIVGVYAIARDITDLKQTEELYRKADRLAVVGQLAAGVAHEIRNPLTALKGFIQLLQMKTEGNENYFAIMLSELERIQMIINEFLMLAKPQAIDFQLKDPQAILQNVIALLETQANMNSIELVAEFDADHGLIECEENQLKQVFINVLKNAIEAMPDGGTIRIQIKSFETGQNLIRFIDQGHGISSDRISRLGEPFYTTKEKGTGLGLMVSYKIIEAHKGEMKIESEIGVGTTVSILFPVAAPHMHLAHQM